MKVHPGKEYQDSAGQGGSPDATGTVAGGGRSDGLASGQRPKLPPPGAWLPLVPEDENLAVCLAHSWADRATDGEAEAFRGGAGFPWTCLNPFRGSRLWKSLLWMHLYLILTGVVVFGTAAGICIHATSTFSTDDLRASCALTREGRSGRGGSRLDLKPLLLTVQATLFFSIAFLYCGGILSTGPVARTWRWLLLMFTIQVALAAAGTAIVSLGDAVETWGEEGEVGFAGMWIFAMNTTGTIVLTAAVMWPVASESFREVWWSLLLATQMIISAIFTQACFYVANWMATRSIHPILGTLLILATVKLVEMLLKLVFIQVRHVSTATCALIVFSFQVGGYLTLRIFLSRLADLGDTMFVSATTAALETVLRLCTTCAAKLTFNGLIRKTRVDQAHRILDIFVIDLVTDFLAEFCAILCACCLCLFAEAPLFEHLGGQDREHVLQAIGIQAIAELAGDYASLLIVFSILPISFAGFFGGNARLLPGFYGAVIALTMATVNLRINIHCFTDP